MSTAVAPNRKARRAKANRLRTGFAAAAAATSAAALTVGVSAPATPDAMNLQYRLTADATDVDLITTGSLFGLLDALGYSTIPLTVAGQTINLNLNYVDNNPVNLYNAINAIPPSTENPSPVCAGSENKNGCRLAPVVTIGDGANGVRDAMNALWTAALGEQLLPYSYSKLKDGDTDTIGVLINNPGRPNGGIGARFSDAASTVPNTGATSDKEQQTKAINNMLDATWEYNPQADFPAVFNLLAITNSLMGVLPPVTALLETYETNPLFLLNEIAVTAGVGGETFAPGDSEGQGVLLGSLGEWLGAAAPATYPALFATIVTGTLPLFEPNAIGTMLVNDVLKKANAKFRFGNPLADVLTPALKILINVAYPDVVTPAALKGNPDLAKAGYGAYDRTFAQEQIKFGSMQPLTREERQQANADAWKAFTTAFKEQAQLPFFGIIEPVLQSPGAAVAPVSAAAKAAPAAAAAAVVEAPVVEAPAPVAAPVEKAAPLAAPVIDDDTIADAPAPEAPTQRVHSRHSTASAGSDSPGDTPGGRSSGRSASRGGR